MESMKTGISPVYCNKYVKLNLQSIKILFQEAILTSLKQFSSTDILLPVVEVSRSFSSSKLMLEMLLSGMVWPTVEIKAASQLVSTNPFPVYSALG